MLRRRARDSAQLRLHHDDVQDLLLDYDYGRLTPEVEAALEAHVRRCEWCRDEGAGHIATERMRAFHQRVKQRPPRGPRPKTLALCAIICLLLGSTGLWLYAGAPLGNLALPRSAAHSVPTPTASISATATTVSSPQTLQAAATIGAKGAVTIAWSPDGKKLAAGANQTGVVLYGADGSVLAHLPGFEGYPAPGALVWSADGSRIAGAGRLTLFVWDAASGALLSRIPLPGTPNADLTVFDTQALTAIGNYPASIFTASGFAQWGANGAITPAPTGAAGPTNIPDPAGPIIALWAAQQGTRIFTANGVTMLGVNDADAQRHAALVRWSPDKRYILWGFPHVPVSSLVLPVSGTSPQSTPTITGAKPSPAPASTALAVPDATIAKYVVAVGQANKPDASVLFWPGATGGQLIIYDATAQPATAVIVNALTGDLLATDANPPADLAPTALSWQSVNPASLAIASLDTPITAYRVATP